MSSCKGPTIYQILCQAKFFFILSLYAKTKELLLLPFRGKTNISLFGNPQYTLYTKTNLFLAGKPLLLLEDLKKSPSVGRIPYTGNAQTVKGNGVF